MRGRTEDVGVELDVFEGAPGSVEGELTLRRAVGVVAAFGVRRLAITRRSAIVNAASSRRFRAFSSGHLNCVSSRSSAGRGSCRVTMITPSTTKATSDSASGYGGMRPGPSWQMKREMLTPRATTHWDELATVRA